MKLEPGLFEWMAWYPEGVPEWLNTNELLAAGYKIDQDFKPFVSVDDLNAKVKETSEEFYNRNYAVIKKIIETTSK